ncbi:MAG: hypothetical protein IJF25_02410, partial [Oscillospiraceae bacterium]|nr:hypothetical protein [Oscillospiraceae bacterium]
IGRSVNFIIVSCSYQCLVKSTEFESISSKVKRDLTAISLQSLQQKDIIIKYNLYKISILSPRRQVLLKFDYSGWFCNAILKFLFEKRVAK